MMEELKNWGLEDDVGKAIANHAENGQQAFSEAVKRFKEAEQNGFSALSNQATYTSERSAIAELKVQYHD